MISEQRCNDYRREAVSVFPSCFIRLCATVNQPPERLMFSCAATGTADPAEVRLECSLADGWRLIFDFHRPRWFPGRPWSAHFLNDYTSLSNARLYQCAFFFFFAKYHRFSPVRLICRNVASSPLPPSFWYFSPPSRWFASAFSDRGGFRIQSCAHSHLPLKDTNAGWGPLFLFSSLRFYATPVFFGSPRRWGVGLVSDETPAHCWPLICLSPTSFPAVSVVPRPLARSSGRNLCKQETFSGLAVLGFLVSFLSFFFFLLPLSPLFICSLDCPGRCVLFA